MKYPMVLFAREDASIRFVNQKESDNHMMRNLHAKFLGYIYGGEAEFWLVEGKIIKVSWEEAKPKGEVKG